MWEITVNFRNSAKNSIGAVLTYSTLLGIFKVVLHFASFCNILLTFASHNDGFKLPSALPHEWLVAEWKEQYILETQQKILLAQFFSIPLPKARVKLC